VRREDGDEAFPAEHHVVVVVVEEYLLPGTWTEGE